VVTQSQHLTLDTRIVKICDRINELLLYLVMISVPLFFIILTRDQFELPKLTIFRILTWLMLAVWGIRIIAARRLNFRNTPLDLPILVWAGLQILTTIITVSRFVSYRGEYENFRGLLTVLNYVVFYYIAVNFIRTRAQINRLLFVILLSGLFTTIYGIAQFFGIDFIAWNPTSITPGRYFSTLGNPNFLAAYLAMVMPLLIIFFIESTSWFRRILFFICFIVMFTALMGTWSRGGFLGLLAALAILAIFGLMRAYRNLKTQTDTQKTGVMAMMLQLMQQHKFWVMIIGLVLAILITISATFGKNHMLRMADTIIHLKEAIKVSRLHIWGPAWEMIKDYPILGTGLDTFKTVFPRYATPEFAAIDGANVSSRTAHNEILQVLATQGIIGLIIVTWLTVMFLINWWKAYGLSKNNWQDRLVLVGLLASWTAYSVQNLFSFGVVAIDTFYWLIIAFIVLFRQTPEKQMQMAPAQNPDPKPVKFFSFLSRFRFPAIILVIGFSLLMSWQVLQSAVADYAYNLGSIYRLRKMWDYCIQAFTRAAELTPTEVKYVVYSGLAYEEKAKTVPPAQQMAMVQKAIAAYRHGVEMNPTNAYYLGNLGRAYSLAASIEPSNQTYFDKSVSYFKQAIHYAPVTVLFYQNLAMTYFSHQKEKEFFSIVNQLAAFDKIEAARLVFTAANNLYNQNQLYQARRYYEKAVYLNPTYVEAYFNLGVTLTRLQETARAISMWYKALELKPAFSPAKQMLERYQTKRSVPPSHVIMHHEK